VTTDVQALLSTALGKIAADDEGGGAPQIGTGACGKTTVEIAAVEDFRMMGFNSG